ncbi:MAG TPA: NAD(P)-dependent alcohol dehydrogenase [Pseudonocardia sp.]|jgi:L-iditol 2-dehydrogenase|uniref:NAD(P)-dependent alcohol dehydrogenase n=1 Tax=Pseudonocardia sp. TaxID=60912 RepID=UPI002F3E4A21
MSEANLVSVLDRPGTVRVEERRRPVPGPGEVLVKVAAVGVCGSDVHFYEHGRIGEFVVCAPLVLGHEASGVIVERGDGAHRHELGQRVALEPGVPCGRCARCRAGGYNLCPEVRFFATPPIDGAFARYVVINENFAYPVPDTVTDEQAALMEPFSVGLWAVRRAGVCAGDTVLVTGAGPIGLLAAQAARVAGAARVVVTDLSAGRRDLALRLGADEALDAREGDLSALGADVMLECSGAQPAVTSGLAAVRPGGTAVLVGMGADEVTLPMSALQVREITVTGTFRYANTYPAAIALAAAGRIQLDPLVTGHYGLNQVEAALTTGSSGEGAVKAVVHPQLDNL